MSRTHAQQHAGGSDRSIHSRTRMMNTLHCFVRAATTTFKVGQRVEAKDNGGSYKKGMVTSVAPLKVRLDRWENAYTWDSVRHIGAKDDN